MSQPDLIAQLREARPTAPEELRERVRLVAADAAPPRRRFTRRKAILVLVPAMAAALLGAALLARNDDTNRELRRGIAVNEDQKGVPELSFGTPRAVTDSANALQSLAPNTKRAQQYSASLELRVKNANAISATTQRALRIVTTLGGFPQAVRVNTADNGGSAYLRLRVPRKNVQLAVRRLGTLGTIVAANVAIQDLQVGINTTDRTIERLQTQLAELRGEPQSEDRDRRIETLVARVERMQRARAATVRVAQYATVELQLSTPAATVDKGDGPLHGLGTAFRWLGIGAVYALALGLPFLALGVLAFLLARTFRRRREEALLSRS